MFTGIITHIGTIIAWTKIPGDDTKCVMQTDMDLRHLAVGASICCSGVCLTATQIDPASGQFTAVLSNETLEKSTAKSWAEGRKINLERSLRLGDELGGHLVYGHVDDVAKIIGWEQVEGSIKATFAAPKQWQAFLAPKGSVSLDGVSLTVNKVDDNDPNHVNFSINLIPHTLEHTTFTYNKVGDQINLEIDPLARYVRRMLVF